MGKVGKDFGEIVAELINHGLSDHEILDQLVKAYGYDSTVEDLAARIRVIKSRLFLDPFPDGDMTSYLEMARICLEHYRKTDIGPQMDLSDEEMVRLAIQLEDYLEHDDDFCPESKDRQHELDPDSVTRADTDPREGCIIDVICKHCGRSGAALIRSEDVDW